MNNNRGSNRRRGRGNNRQQGGNQANRIDSRARGNAPQLLEKYKKLAHDASLNGDRVQAEYYLQFADHYFRVIADSRAVRDEQQQRMRPQGDREQSYDEEFRDDEDQCQRAPRENGRDGGRDSRREQANDDGREQAESEDRAASEGDEFEPAENPFTRDNRSRRSNGERQSRPRREAGNGRERANEEVAAEGAQEDEGPRFDPNSLPPPLSVVEEEAPKPRRTRARKPRVSKEANGGEELEIAS